MCEFRMAMSMMQRRVLLVLDDDPQVCRVMERCLKDRFEEIFTETNPIRAHAVLETQRVTHILADLRLGGEADGAAFVTFWKREFSHIERAVIFTAGDVHNVGVDGCERFAPEIDAIISKVDGIDAIIAALIGDAK